MSWNIIATLGCPKELHDVYRPRCIEDMVVQRLIKSTDCNNFPNLKFLGKCRECGVVYYPSYYEKRQNGAIVRTFLKHTDSTQYFGCTTATVFSTSVLKQVCSLITSGHCNFNAIVAWYHSKIGDQTLQTMDTNKLEDAYFTFNIGGVTNQFNTLIRLNLPS